MPKKEDNNSVLDLILDIVPGDPFGLIELLVNLLSL